MTIDNTDINYTSPGDLFSIENRVCLVTGAAGHLGTQMAAALAAAGGIIYLNGRDEKKLQKLCDKLRGFGGKCEVLAFDITEDQSIDHALDKISKENARLDVLVNNAFAGASGRFSATEKQQYLDSYNSGVGSTVSLVNKASHLLQAGASPHLMSSIINIASMYGMVSPDPGIYGSSGHDNPPSYGTMKAALIQYTRYAATNLAQHNIRVNSISPGAFPNPVVKQNMPELWDTLNTRQPMKRVGRADELQGALLYLASNASSYVTGENLVVDGGWTAW